MLVKPPMEKLLPRTENRYTLAILAAKAPASWLLAPADG